MPALPVWLDLRSILGREGFGAFLVLTGFALSVAMVNMQKYVYVHWHFKFPLFITMTHMVAAFGSVSFAIFLLKLGGSDTLAPVVSSPGPGEDEERSTDTRRSSSWSSRARFVHIFKKVVPFSVFNIISLACSNVALVYIYPSLHSMLQNLGPCWTVLLSYSCPDASNLIRIYNWAAYLALIPVCTGGALCVLGDPGTPAVFGLVCSMLTTFFRCLKLVVQYRFYEGGADDEKSGQENQSSSSLKRPTAASTEDVGGNKQAQQEKVGGIWLMYYAIPFNFVAFFLWSLAVEGLQPWYLFFGDRHMGSVVAVRSGPASVGRVGGGGVAEEAARAAGLETSWTGAPWSGQLFLVLLAFFAAGFNITGFLSLECMSATLYTVVGNLKTPTIIASSALVFGADTISRMQVLGFCVAFFGAWSYGRFGKEEKRSASERLCCMSCCAGYKIDRESEVNSYENAPLASTITKDDAVGGGAEMVGVVIGTEKESGSISPR